MRKILYSFLLGFAALIVSCDYNDPNDGKFNADPEFGWVEFPQTDAVVTAYAGCPVVEVPIVLDAPVNANGVDITYTITDVVGSTAGLSTYATIPAGSTTGGFYITNSDMITSPIEFTLTLVSTNKGNVSVGGPDSVAGDQTVTVRVIPGLQRFAATYDVFETSAAGEFEYTSAVTVGDEPNEIIISNIFEISNSAQASIFVNADGTVSFPDFEDNQVVAGAFFQGLEGSADPCTGEIEVTFNLVSATGTVLEGPVTMSLTRR